MATSISHSDGVKVGEVFTPVEWAEWLVDRWGLYDAWIAGASICDPTAGQGAFALALLRLARSRGIHLTQELLSRLTLIELHSEHLLAFKNKALQNFSVDFPSSQLLVSDVITDPPCTKFDFLVGNPPWANFTDLPDWYKDELKPYFVAEGLVPDRKKVLLGSSRTDVAALVLKVVLGRLLSKDGIGCFYLPLSLFSGDDAHRGFRDYIANHRRFAVDEVCEFTKTKVFNGVGTSYCCARFKMDQMQEFPVRYFRESGDDWIEHRAIPLNTPSDQWRVLARDQSDAFDEAIDVALLPEQKPRQGVNTCGANKVFIFDEKPVHLPDEYVFPLATKDIWKHGGLVPTKWILLPYDRDSGRPLPWSEIERHAELCRHLTEAKEILQERKGTLIGSSISKGIWWSLLGVGPYSFAPYKVIWEAYGKSDFNPIVLHDCAGQVWQANQAMQAFIPCWEKADAKRICAGLKHPSILSLLQQLNGDGKCNWAQPGKIKKVLSFDQPEYHQPLLFAEKRATYRTRKSTVPK
jgi:hypothetical protein